MSEYALLYLLAYNFTSTYFLPLLKEFSYPFIFTVLYAVLDEIHQLFISGRAGKLLDVMIDSFGALIMMGLLFVLKKYVTKRCKPKKTMV